MNWFAVDKFESTESKNVAEALEKNLRRDRRFGGDMEATYLLRECAHRNNLLVRAASPGPPNAC